MVPMSNKETSEFIEGLIELCDRLEALAVGLRQQTQAIMKTEAKAGIPEDRFNVLKWEIEKGSRLGNYQVAYQRHNLPENWVHCFSVLKANLSFIDNPFLEEDYEFRYWIYPQKYRDRIFRKKLVEAKG